MTSSTLKPSCKQQKAKKIYMAFPYWHKSPAAQKELAYEASKAAARLIQEGYLVYSPLSHKLAIENSGISIDKRSWERINKEFILWADEFWVFQVAGPAYSEEFPIELDVAFREFKMVRYFKFQLL